MFAFVFKGQDKLFFLDGTTKTGKVLEIGPEQIILRADYEKTEFPRSTILLIEFADGSFEKINTPEKNVIASPDKKENFHYKQQEKEFYNYNRVSLNSLALCNADIAAFYERLLHSKKIGLGVMGAYNFNLYVNSSNAFLAILNNAKKNYDLGAYINFYSGRTDKRTYLYFGAMVKYTSFSYSSLKEDSTKVGNVVSVNISYTPAKGSQLATIFTVGTHSDITKNFFIKTIFGLGAFKLRGDYKSQFNMIVNQNNTNNQGQNNKPLTYNTLPKFYFGINIGFKL
ncbi:MAG: hypothetical protein H0U95_00740 [Bacteroidetes bacterium]|nr:hypothetical protein [Bacteroidota bacterium]